MPQTKPAYTEENKREVLAHLTSTGQSLKQTAAYFGISANSLRKAELRRHATHSSARAGGARGGRAVRRGARLQTKLTLLTALLLLPLGWLLAAETPQSPKVETFVTPKQDRAGLTSNTPIDKSLPNVLILGDSISIGYTRQVREGLQGKANVIRPNANCGDTRHGLAQIETWLGDGNWQVIHFNWGLHDLCYRNPELKTPGQRDKVKGTLSVPLPEYEKNLETLVERLKKTGAKLIFANTTLVPEGEAGRFPGDEVKYNAAAQRVMEKHGVPIDDLHATAKAFPSAMFAGPGNVHFSAEGSAKLAGQVVAKVEAALPPPPTAAPKKSAKK